MTMEKIITMQDLEKMNLTEVLELIKKRVRVTKEVYLIFAHECEDRCISRKEIVEKYGSTAKYYANGQFIVQNVEVCSLVRPGPSPIPPKKRR